MECDVQSVYDYDTLGFAIGKKSPANAIPALLMKDSSTADADRLRSAFDTMATSGGVELCHIIGRTPEAMDKSMAFGGKKPEIEVNITQKDLDEVREFLCEEGSGHVDFVHLGCPHYSLEQIADVAQFLEGKKINSNVELHIWTAPAIRYLAELNGFAEIIESAGSRLLAGSCALVTGKLPKGARRIAFNSSKQANPLKSLFNGSVYYGSSQDCLKAAISGKWEVA